VPTLLGEGVGVVCAAKLHAGEDEEEGEHIDGLEAGLLVCIHGFEPEEQERPDLRVGLLEEEREAGLSDADAPPRSPVHQATRDEELLDTLIGTRDLGGALVADARDYKVQYIIPLLAGVAVEEGDVDLGGHDEGR